MAIFRGRVARFILARSLHDVLDFVEPVEAEKRRAARGFGIGRDAGGLKPPAQGGGRQVEPPA
jgi:hypothetical protein